MRSKFLFVFSVFLFPFFLLSQTEGVEEVEEQLGDGNLVITDTITQKRPKIDPLAPSTAAFYSAILPGLGQAYNKKYWKIPIVYGAIGTSLFFYFDQNSELNRTRDAFRRRLAGLDDEFPNISTEGLERAQTQFRRNRDVSLLVAFALYALNILDANIDAHLLSFNVDENLALQPNFEFNTFNAKTNLGISLNFKF